MSCSAAAAIRMCEVNSNGWTATALATTNTTERAAKSAATAQCAFRRPVGSILDDDEEHFAQQAQQQLQEAYKQVNRQTEGAPLAHKHQPRRPHLISNCSIRRMESARYATTATPTTANNNQQQQQQHQRRPLLDRRGRRMKRRRSSRRTNLPALEQFPEPMNLSATTSATREDLQSQLASLMVPDEASIWAAATAASSMGGQGRLSNGAQISDQLNVLINCRPYERHYAPFGAQVPHPGEQQALNQLARQQALQFASLHSLSQVASVLQQQQQQQQLHQQQQQHQQQQHRHSLHQAGQAEVRAGSQVLQLVPGKRPRQLRKCRKVYGMDQRQLWCTQCKWKKACSRFCDYRQRQSAQAAVDLLSATR